MTYFHMFYTNSREAGVSWWYLINACYGYLLLCSKPPQNPLLLSLLVLWVAWAQAQAFPLVSHVVAGRWRQVVWRLPGPAPDGSLAAGGWHWLAVTAQICWHRDPDVAFLCGVDSLHGGPPPWWSVLRASVPKGGKQKQLNKLKAMLGDGISSLPLYFIH